MRGWDLGEGPKAGDTNPPRSSQVQAVRLIAEGKAPRLPQPEEGATYEGIQKKETARVSASPAHLKPACAVSWFWGLPGPNSLKPEEGA